MAGRSKVNNANWALGFFGMAAVAALTGFLLVANWLDRLVNDGADANSLWLTQGAFAFLVTTVFAFSSFKCLLDHIAEHADASGEERN